VGPTRPKAPSDPIREQPGEGEGLGRARRPSPSHLPLPIAVEPERFDARRRGQADLDEIAVSLAADSLRQAQEAVTALGGASRSR